jgi:methylenetetrahydrofolate dehydrogenase (NADP+) / methenyltetrahydrofolate cyclohydrolase
MPARILDGTKIANDIKGELVAEVRTLTAAGARPGLAVVLVGHDPGSEIYVRHKVKACEELGIYSEKFTPEDNVSTDELLRLIDDLNRRDEIDGILVQLPLPKQVDSKRVLLAVSPAKDVDGFHPLNVGNLSTQRPGLVSCTPAGCMEIPSKVRTQWLSDAATSSASPSQCCSPMPMLRSRSATRRPATSREFVAQQTSSSQPSAAPA